ncbi:uncharacterized protein LOC108738531 [Agrilus planipennis]|uniref:Uncharacterized protein LOC108738531 n=1 Tax=Agrilus planipennis TaxID=224129 RepID=A0A1W4X3W4_AGRPL|nr:uncharacterized protein LOC108738531 [Agrilus planipennis]
MLEVFLELGLILVLFYCLTLATVNEDNRRILDRKGEQVRKRSGKTKNNEKKLNSTSSRSYHHTEDSIAIKRQKKPFILPYEDLFKSFSSKTEEPNKVRDAFHKFSKYPLLDLNRQIRNREKSVGTSHIQTTEKTTSTDNNKCTKSGTQTSFQCLNFESRHLPVESTKIKRDWVNTRSYCGKTTIGDRRIEEKESSITFTPSFHDRLERQLVDLIQKYWDQCVVERNNRNRSHSTPQIVNSKSFSQFNTVLSDHHKLDSIQSIHMKPYKGIWSNLLEDVTVLDCNSSFSQIILNSHREDMKKSFNISTEEENEEAVNCEDLESPKTEHKPAKTRQIKSIKSLLKKELEEILSADEDKSKSPKILENCRNPSNVYVNQRVELRTSLDKSIQQKLLEVRLSQMDPQNHKPLDEGILRTTSYQALVDNLQFMANFIQKNCSIHNEPVFDCFEALNVSRSRFLLNRQLINALRSKVSHSSNCLENGDENGKDAHVVVLNELGNT